MNERSIPSHSRSTAFGGLLLAAISTVSCGKKSDESARHDSTSSASGAAVAAAKANSAQLAAAAAVAAAKSSAPTAETRPAPTPSGDGSVVAASVTIPAGSLVVGTACGEQPRLPSEEASGISVEMAEFDIDAYPYPNDPAKPPMTGVTQAEAKDLCAARGRRLCTELEWERACKGPSNTRYEYGDKFDAKACPSGTLTPSATGSAPACKSGFGVYAMHGFVAEWTSSPWNRSDETIDAGGATLPSAGSGSEDAAGAGEGSVALRGGSGSAPYAHMRCSASRKGDPDKKSRSVGFRCCGGAESPAAYPMPLEPTATAFDPVENPPEKLVSRVRNAMRNGGFKDAPGTQGNVRSLWRWRPVANEEIFTVLYESVGADGTKTIQPLAVLLCEKTAQLLARVKTSVDEVSAPTPDASFGRIQFTAKRGEDSGAIGFEYKFGAVVTSQPDWLSGNKSAKPAR